MSGSYAVVEHTLSYRNKPQTINLKLYNKDVSNMIICRLLRWGVPFSFRVLGGDFSVMKA